MALMATEVRSLTVAPDTGHCPVCQGKVVFTHFSYVGNNQNMRVFRCLGCGIAYRAATATTRDPERQNAYKKRRGKKLPNEGSPANPVLSSELARQLLHETPPPTVKAET